ncbi:MAG: hypothetical protein WDO71_14355 [Bacteroidota bacterium]
MPQSYSQSRALWAITRASFKAIFNQPTAIVFSLLFPIIFIMIFGAFGSGGGVSYKIALEPGCDTANVFYSALKNNPQIRIIKYPDTAVMNKELEKEDLPPLSIFHKQKIHYKNRILLSIQGPPQPAVIRLAHSGRCWNT